MFNQSGRLVKKKKTTVQLNTKDPVFNETLNFEVTPHQLDSSKFLISLCNRAPELDLDMRAGVSGHTGHTGHLEEIGLQDSSDQDNNTFYLDR